MLPTSYPAETFIALNTFISNVKDKISLLANIFVIWYDQALCLRYENAVQP